MAIRTWWLDQFQPKHVVALLGNGNGTFQAPKSFTTVNAISALATGEFNGDGRPDLVTAVPILIVSACFSATEMAHSRSRETFPSAGPDCRNCGRHEWRRDSPTSGRPTQVRATSLCCWETVMTSGRIQFYSCRQSVVSDARRLQQRWAT